MSDKNYLNIFIEPILKSKDYRPKFGDSSKKEGVTLAEFYELYGSDPFYSWIGLDTDLMYAAHRAAGGMTSLYRQIGIGCESLFRQIIIDLTQYSKPEFAVWSYKTKTQSGRTKTLKLDARLELGAIQNRQVSDRITDWMNDYCQQIDAEVPTNGVVFEVRQGYKSKDSKRQNADIDNAAVAWSKGYLPIFAIFSSQIDADIVLRYRNNRSGILIGSAASDPTVSLYAFCEQVIGYDLAGFFGRNSSQIQKHVHEIIQTLLSAE
ncbi:MAG TPA: hypothetical protein G4N96_02780 [Chloroflexi bacterium]|nr:hypothetical protein [Chloroflexota bacterium]